MPLSKETKSKLISFLHRRIKPGEAFLLARLLADRIPVNDEYIDKPWEQTIQYRKNVDSVVFSLNDYLHISVIDQEALYKSIDSIWMWRYNVASGNSNLIFTGEANNVIDDFSGVMRTVNCGEIGTVTDIVNDTNYIYGLFKEVVTSTWDQR